MNKVAVITGVAGGYDKPVEQNPISGVDFIFFTDGVSVPKAGSIWQVEDLNTPPGLDPRRMAKFPKINPQRYPLLREYDYTLWIDGTLHIKDPSYVDTMISHVKNGLVFSPHFENRDAYSEATITGHPKYWNEPLSQQAEFYREEGFPEGTQLYECTTLGMDPNHPEALRLSENWLEHNLFWSYQDQVSLPFCVWRFGIEPGLLPQSWRKYDWMQMGIHQKDEANNG